MGHNIDFVNLLNLPEKVICMNCDNEMCSMFEEYDIDCGVPEASNNDGLLVLDVTCGVCGFTREIKFKTEQIK